MILASPFLNKKLSRLIGTSQMKWNIIMKIKTNIIFYFYAYMYWRGMKNISVDFEIAITVSLWLVDYSYDHAIKYPGLSNTYS